MYQEPVSVPIKPGMMAEESLRSKYLYKAVLLFLKVIPMLLAFFDILNTTLGFCGIECSLVSYIGGVSFLTLAFLYLASYVFQFCEYHRIFLHYIVLSNLVSIIDFEFGIPVSNRILLDIHFILLGLALFFALYLYLRQKNEHGSDKGLSAEVDRRDRRRKQLPHGRRGEESGRCCSPVFQER